MLKENLLDTMHDNTKITKLIESENNYINFLL